MAALMADGVEVVRQSHLKSECKGAQRGAALKAIGAAILCVAAVIAVCSVATGQSVELKEQKDVGSMKNINRLLKHLDQLSATAHKGEERDKHADVQVKEMDDMGSDADAPNGVKHGIAHEAEDAEKSLKSSDSGDSERKSKGKRAVIAAKMKALQEQILSDFSKVTGFGKSAGYIPPVKLPHV